MKYEVLDKAHWTEEAMLDRLYGLDPRAGLDASHLDSCAECSARFSSLQARRSVVVDAHAPVSEDRLRAQRLAVFARIETARRPWVWRLVPAAATALVVMMGVALHQPAPVVEPKPVAVLAQSDRELLSEIATLMEEDEPRAAVPIRGLFADSGAPGAQVEVQ